MSFGAFWELLSLGGCAADTGPNPALFTLSVSKSFNFDWGWSQSRFWNFTFFFGGGGSLVFAEEGFWLASCPGWLNWENLVSVARIPFELPFLVWCKAFFPLTLFSTKLLACWLSSCCLILELTPFKALFASDENLQSASGLWEWFRSLGVSCSVFFTERLGCMRREFSGFVLRICELAFSWLRLCLEVRKGIPFLGFCKESPTLKFCLMASASESISLVSQSLLFSFLPSPLFSCNWQVRNQSLSRQSRVEKTIAIFKTYIDIDSQEW